MKKLYIDLEFKESDLINLRNLNTRGKANIKAISSVWCGDVVIYYDDLTQNYKATLNLRRSDGMLIKQLVICEQMYLDETIRICKERLSFIYNKAKEDQKQSKPEKIRLVFEVMEAFRELVASTSYGDIMIRNNPIDERKLPNFEARFQFINEEKFYITIAQSSDLWQVLDKAQRFIDNLTTLNNNE
jgi:hypothetical protein